MKKLNIDLDKTQIVMFKAEWCPDCVMMEPIISELDKWIKKNNLQIEINKIDVDEYDLYQKEQEFKVKEVPSFYLIHKREKHFINYEYTPLEMFQNKINEVLKVNRILNSKA